MPHTHDALSHFPLLIRNDFKTHPFSVERKNRFYHHSTWFAFRWNEEKNHVLIRIIKKKGKRTSSTQFFSMHMMVFSDSFSLFLSLSLSCILSRSPSFPLIFFSFSLFLSACFVVYANKSRFFVISFHIQSYWYEPCMFFFLVSFIVDAIHREKCFVSIKTCSHANKNPGACDAIDV